MIAASELILNPDGSVYHLHLLPGQIAPTVITVGDPERVNQVSRRFDQVEHRVTAREFVTHTGRIGDRRISVVSTGIGTDNIDIVLNELDALVNIDLKTRTVRAEHTRLTFLRLGTSGAFQPDLELGSFLLSEAALGMDGLLPYYTGRQKVPAGLAGLELPVDPILVRPELPPAFADSDLPRGITLTAAGFYAPQGRSLRLPSAYTPETLSALRNWRTPDGLRLTNIEMETAGIYGLANALGHQSASLSVLLANRALGTFHDAPGVAVEKLIDTGLATCLGL